MTTNEFKSYVMNLKARGYDHGQIARSLGMDILEFEQKVQAAFDGVEVKVEVKKPENKVEKKPVVKVKEIIQDDPEDPEMNKPILNEVITEEDS
jgi:hypothetical protein